MSTASKGRGNEHKVRDAFIEHGLWVIRAAGSKGEADLLAIGDGIIYAINVKTNQYAPPKERDAMVGMMKFGSNIIPVLARVDDRVKEPMYKYYDEVDAEWKMIKRVEVLLFTVKSRTKLPKPSTQSPKKSERKQTQSNG